MSTIKVSTPKVRNVPEKSASKYEVGQTETGNDGNEYIVVLNEKGNHSWQKHETELKAPKKASKKPSTPEPKENAPKEKKKVVKKLDFDKVESDNIPETQSESHTEPEETKTTEKKKKSERKAPKEHAGDYEEGHEMLGLDGKMHVVQSTSKGIKRWVACK